MHDAQCAVAGRKLLVVKCVNILIAINSAQHNITARVRQLRSYILPMSAAQTVPVCTRPSKQLFLAMSAFKREFTLLNINLNFVNEIKIIHIIKVYSSQKNELANTILAM